MRAKLISFIIIIVGFTLLVNHKTIQAQTIETVAGGLGDNTEATNTSLVSPKGLAVDKLGNIFISDGGHATIRKVDATTGIITTVAGIGKNFAADDGGFSGDGGAAKNAELNNPGGVAVDGSGNLYIADIANQRIRKVDGTTGIITTLAGNGMRGFNGDGISASSAQLNFPSDVLVNPSGELYIVDGGNHRIRKVDLATGIISTIVGNGTRGFSGDGGTAVSAQLASPTGISIDSLGNLYIADLGNQRIRKVDATTSIITTVAGNGTSGFSGDGGIANLAQLSFPQAITVDQSGNLYIADFNNQRIRKVDAATGFISTVAGNGTQGFGGDEDQGILAQFDNPLDVVLDESGNLLIADANNNRLRKLNTSTGIITTIAGNGFVSFGGDGSAATSAQFFGPGSVAVDASGNLFIADVDNRRVRRVDGTTGIITTVAGNGTQGFSGDGGAATSAQLYPWGVAVDASGNLYIADRFNYRIRKVNAATGIISTVVGNGTFGFSGDGGTATSAQLKNPYSVAVDASGSLYIVDLSDQRIRKVDGATGIITTVAGNGTQGFSGDGGAATSAQLNNPTSVAVDASGNLYIADKDNQRIRKVDGATGIITTEAGNGLRGFNGDGEAATLAQLNFPQGVAIDASGNLYIADRLNHRIRKVDSSTGIITSVVGNGTFGFSGDGGAATNAELKSPADITFDVSGNLYIADIGNDRIRKVTGLTQNDVVPPTVITQDTVVVLDATGNITITPEFINNGSSDNVTATEDLVFALDQTMFDCTSLGDNTVELTVTDESGNSASSTATVTVLDGGSCDNDLEELFITTVAGTGVAGYNGDNIAATNAQLQSASDVVVDATGNLYIGDLLNSRVRKVDTSGTITTIAGTGSPGFNGDNIPATTAELGIPISLALDQIGNLYIVDPGEHRVRKVDTSGIITTIAGTGDEGYNGDNIIATNAQLRGPGGVAVDLTGNVYIADRFNHRVRKVDATGNITTVAGNGVAGYNGDNISSTSAQLDDPISVVVDALGNLYITDRGNKRIRKVDPMGIITTVAGTGVLGYNGDNILAVTAQIGSSYGVSVDASGNLYIADQGNNRIRKVDGATGIITTVAGNGMSGFSGDGGIATSAQLNNPTGVAVDASGNLYIADSGNDRIRKVSTSQGEVSRDVGNTEVFAGIGFNNNRKAIPVTMGEDGLIESISIFHEGGSGNMLLAVYTDNEGVPGARLGVTPLTPVAVTQGWQTIDLSSPVGAVNGQTVWLAWSFQSSTGIRFQENTSGRAKSPQSWSENMPADFGSSTLANFTFSVYATYSSFTPTLPNDPSELNATAQPDVSIEVSWVDNSDNESSFEIERSETSGNGFVAIATVAANTTTYTDNTTSTNTEYFYRVRAVNSAGNSGYTTEASAITGEAPLVVGNTEVFADIGFNNNRKAIPVTMGEDGLIESISIFHEGGSGNMLLAVYTDNEGVPGARLGVTPLTPVAATQGWQTIDLSSPVGAVNGQTVWLAWTFQSPTGIRFQENTSGRAKSPQSWSENMPADFGSSTLTNFTFSVYATYSSFTPTLPNDPSELNATAQPDVSIEVSWVDNSDNESSFEIERSETSGNGFVAIATVAANTTTYTDNTTSTNTEYFYRVRAVNSAGNSGYTTEASAITGEAPLVVGNTEVFADIGFNNNRKAIPVTMGEDGLIESISIFHEGGSGNMLLAVYTDNEGVPGARLGVTPLTPVAATQGWQTIDLSSPVGAVNGQTVWLAWSFQSSTGIRFQENTSGRAKSPQGWSENMPADFGSSTLANFTFSVYATYSSFTPTLPNDPSELNATAQPDVSIEVSWVDNSDNESSFEIERSETSGNGFVAIATVAANTTTYTDNTTSTNTEYFYRVRAVNSAGNSGYTTEASAITGEAPLVVGNTEVFADIGFNNNRKAIPVTMGEDGLIESISIFHEGGSGNMLLAVYTDNEGVPGARLGVTPLTPVAATQGWQTIDLSSPVGAVNGQTVWLAWSFQSSTGIRFQENTSGRAKSPQSWSENMPADFGSSTLANFTFSVYATYSSSGTTPSSIADSDFDAFGQEITPVVYPNPSGSTGFTYQFHSDSQENAVIQISDMGGKLVYKNTLEIVEGNNTLQITPNLKSGIYLMQVTGNLIELQERISIRN